MGLGTFCTDFNTGQNYALIKKKKKTKIFLMYKEIEMGSGAKPYMRKGFLIHEEICKYFTISEEAVSHV